MENNQSNNTETLLEETNAGKQYEDFPIAVVGLPDAGKSTFFARLYGAQLNLDDTDESKDYSLAFPSAVDEDSSETLKNIQRLWEWICSNFDKKLKTLSSIDLIFTNSGKGLKRNLKVQTSDVPGETFQVIFNDEKLAVDPSELKTIRKDFRHKFPNVRGAIILIPRDKASDPDSISLIRSMLEELPKYHGRGFGRQPVFKLVVFSKAGTPVVDEALESKIKALQAQWQRQGHKWVRVFASESLIDLKESRDAEGNTRWFLKDSSEPREMPKWILSPYDVALQFPKLLQSFRRGRLIQRILITTATVCLIAGAWVLNGNKLDTQRYEAIRNATPGQLRHLTENYLLQPSASKSNLFYPFRHQLDHVVRKWNEQTFALDGPLSSTDLDSAYAELARIEGGKLWTYVDREEFHKRQLDIRESRTKTETRFVSDMEEWRSNALEATNPLSVIDSKQFDFPRMESLRPRFYEHRSGLRNDYENEREKVQGYLSIFRDWQTQIPQSLRYLEEISEQQLLFGESKNLLRQGLDTLRDQLSSEDIEIRPLQSREMLRRLQVAMRHHGMDLAKVNQDIEKATAKIRMLEEKSARQEEALRQVNDWGTRISLSEQTAREMLDLPQAQVWRERERHWRNRLQASADLHRTMLDQLSAEGENRERRREILDSFVSNLEANHSPAHIRDAKARISTIDLDFERERVSRYIEVFGNWRAEIPKTVNYLDEVLTGESFQFDESIGNLNTSLERLRRELATSGIEQIPFQSRQLLESLSAAMERQNLDVQKINQDIQRANTKIRQLESKSAQQEEALRQVNDWGTRISLSEQTAGEMLDLPQAQEWRERERHWRNRLQASADLLRGIKQELSTNNTDPYQQRSILTGFASSSSADHAPEHRRDAKLERERINVQIDEIEQKWFNVVEGFANFRQTPSTIGELEERISSYDSILRQQARNYIRQHKDERQSIQDAIKTARDHVTELGSQYRSQFRKANDSNADNRLQARREIARILIELNSTFDQENAIAWGQDWSIRIRERARDAASNPLRFDDDDINERRKSLDLLTEFGESMGLPSDHFSEATSLASRLDQKWAQARWQIVQRTVNAEENGRRFAAAINELNSYLKRQDTPYVIMQDDANAEIARVSQVWQREITHKLEELRNSPLVERSDFEERRKSVSSIIEPFEAIRPLPPELMEIRRTTLQTIDENLRNWHATRINNLLSELPKTPDGQPVLTRWDQIDNLRERFLELCNDSDMQRISDRDVNRAMRAIERLDGLNGQSRLTIELETLKIIMPNDGNYWGHNFPQPTLELKHGPRVLWNIQLEERRNSPSATDMAGVSRQYSVVENKDQNEFVVIALGWNTRPLIENLNVNKGDKVALTFKVNRQESVPLEIHIISHAQTPGQLLVVNGNEFKDGTTVRVNPRMGARRFQSRIDAEFRTNRPSGAERFRIPERFDRW